MLGVNGVAGCQMPGRIPLMDVRAGFVGPRVVPETIQIVAQIPSDIRERAQTRYGVTEIALFVFATRCGLRLVRRDIKDHGDDDVAIASEAQHAVPPLPVSQVEAAEVDAWT